jgi:hypothetical protein
MGRSFVHVEVRVETSIVAISYLPTQPPLELIVDEYRAAFFTCRISVVYRERYSNLFEFTSRFPNLF